MAKAPPKIKTKPRPGGAGMMVGLLGGSGMMLASNLGTAAINAGAAVGAGAIAANTLEDIVRTLAENPMALAAIAAVVGLLILK